MTNYFDVGDTLDGDIGYNKIIGQYIYFYVNGKMKVKAKITGWGFVFDDRGRHISVHFDKRTMKKLQKLFNKNPDMYWTIHTKNEEDEPAKVISIIGDVHV
jgi:hypothetical protein